MGHIRARIRFGSTIRSVTGLPEMPRFCSKVGTLSPSALALAQRVAYSGVETYMQRGLPWPSGAYGGATPCLFLGLAGIGRFYSRLALPDLPSVLLVRPGVKEGPAGRAVERPQTRGSAPPHRSSRSVPGAAGSDR